MRRLAPFALLSLLLLPCADASAQEATPEMLDAEARARFELAMVHIENGQFEDAAREFHAAYELSHRDELLYNEFLAWRDGGHPGRAANSLEAYLATLPEDAPDRANLEARLRPLREQAERIRAAEQAGDEEPDRPPPDAPESDGGGPHPVGFALIGVGAAVAIAGAVVGGVALSISDDLAGACAGGVCPPERQGDADTGEALAITADVLLPVGAATAIVGLILLFTVTEGDDAPTAALACDGAGCVGAVRGAF